MSICTVAKESWLRKVPDICSYWPVRFGVNDICPSQVTRCSGGWATVDVPGSSHVSHALLEPGQIVSSDTTA